MRSVLVLAALALVGGCSPSGSPPATLASTQVIGFTSYVTGGINVLVKDPNGQLRTCYWDGADRSAWSCTHVPPLPSP
jgi:hypothetical protein